MVICLGRGMRCSLRLLIREEGYDGWRLDELKELKKVFEDSLLQAERKCKPGFMKHPKAFLDFCKWKVDIGYKILNISEKIKQLGDE